ncbi:hypothetical protein ACVNF4_21300 [Streptomyces sp. S6]
MLYQVLEPFPDARSALLRAREIMRESADRVSAPWPQLESISTAEQYAHTVRSFGTARIGADRDPVAVFPFLDELVRRDAITFDAVQPRSVILGELRLGPELGDLWPLPEGVTVSLNQIPPFGTRDTEPEDDCTEAELDGMVDVLGPLSLDVDWRCGWRGLPVFKNCGVRICLNSVRVSQHTEVAPGEFGVWVELGTRVTWTPEGEAWRRDSGLRLGKEQQA